MPKSSVSWPLFEDYRIEHGVLWAVGKQVGDYDPLTRPELAAEFAKLLEGDEMGLLEFARKWGLLGWDTSRVPPENGDPLPWIWGQVQTVRLVLKLYHYLQERDDEGLAKFLQAHRTSVQFDRDIVVAKVPTFKDPTFAFAAGGREPKQLAEETISNIITDGMEKLGFFVRPDPLRVLPHCPSLMTAVYWHVADIVADGQRLRPCEDCGALFVVTDNRQKYCPPPQWTGKRGSSCGFRARKRRQRLSKGD